MNADQLLAQANKIGTEASKQTGVAFTPVTPVPPPSTTISKDSLAQTNAVVVPPAPTTSVASDLSSSASQVSEAQKAINAETAKAEALAASATGTANESKSTLQALADKIMGVQSSQAQAEADAGIPQKAQKVTDVTNQIEASTRAQTNELRALDNTGLTDVQKAQQSREINRKYAFEQADLALIQSAANRDYATAQSIIDNKIKLQLEPLKTQFDLTKMFYDDNRADMTNAQKKAFDLKIGVLENNLKTAEANQTAIGNIQIEALKNGITIPSAVLAQINKAQTPNEVYSILQKAGISLQDPLDRAFKSAQLANIYSQINERKIESEAKLNQLPGPVQTRVQTIAGQFDTEQAVKNYQVSAEALDAMKGAGTSPTDDQSRIYAFAKIMDPNSVVRESEYKTVQDYSQSLLERIGFKAKRVFDNSGFLTNEARTFMENTLTNRVASSEKAVNNIYNEYGRRINKVTGRNDGVEYITDYTKAFNAPTVGVAKEGDTKDYAGISYKVVNGEWVPQVK